MRAARTRSIVIALVIGAVLMTGSAPVSARSRHSVSQKRLVETRRQLRAARTRLTALKRTDAQLMSTIQVVQGQLDSAKGLLRDAQMSLGELDARMKSQLRTIAKLDSKRQARAKQLNGRVASLYMMGPGIEADALMTATDFTAFADRSSAFDFILRNDKLQMEDMSRLASRTRHAREQLRYDADHAAVWRARVSERVALVWDALSTHRAAENALKRRIGAFQDEVRSLEAEQARITGLITSRGSYSVGAISLNGFQWPVNGRKINSPYGPRWGGFHTGLDIDCNTGDPIYAARAGRVIASEWGGGYGNMIILDHGNGVSTLYAHQSRLYAGNGSEVSRGQKIGACGSTGHSTGDHLHFEIRVNGNHRNPRPYLP